MGGWDDLGTTSISSLNYNILLTFLSLLGELGSVYVKEGSPFLKFSLLAMKASRTFMADGLQQSSLLVSFYGECLDDYLMIISSCIF